MATTKNLIISFGIPFISFFSNVQYLSLKYFTNVPAIKETILNIKIIVATFDGTIKNKTAKTFMSTTSANPPASENLAACRTNNTFLPIKSASHNPNTDKIGKIIKNAQAYLPAYLAKRSSAIHATANPHIAEKIKSFLFISFCKFNIFQIPLTRPLKSDMIFKYKLFKDFMYLFIHLLFGAAIGYKIKNLPLAIILAIASHYLLDLPPHTDYAVQEEHRKQWRKLLLGFSKLALDVCAGFLLIFFFSKNQPAIYICALAGIVPDLLTPFRYAFPKNKILEAHYQFHSKKVHFLEKSKVSKFWRIIIQLAVTAACIILLTKVF